MLADSRLNVRNNAAKKILEARKSQSSNIITKFESPVINFNAKDYTVLVNWKKVEIIPPLIARLLTNEDLEEITKGSDDSLLKLNPLFNMPCHIVRW